MAIDANISATLMLYQNNKKPQSLKLQTDGEFLPFLRSLFHQGLQACLTAVILVHDLEPEAFKKLVSTKDFPSFIQILLTFASIPSGITLAVLDSGLYHEGTQKLAVFSLSFSY